MDYNLKEVADRIKDLREAKGYTQEELAKLTGVSLEDYKVLEQGETDFSFTFIYKCAKACNVEVGGYKYNSYLVCYYKKRRGT